MGRDTWKNDVKTLFFIFNTFSVVGVGLILFSSGVGTGAIKEMKGWDIMNIVLGLVHVACGIYGYCSAMAENEKMLQGYAALMCVNSVRYVVMLVQLSKDTRFTSWKKGADDFHPEFLMAVFILITIITMVSMLLTCTLAAIAPRSATAADQLPGRRAVIPLKPSA